VKLCWMEEVQMVGILLQSHLYQTYHTKNWRISADCQGFLAMMRLLTIIEIWSLNTSYVWSLSELVSRSMFVTNVTLIETEFQISEECYLL
jgi:hypothetical protein